MTIRQVRLLSIAVCAAASAWVGVPALSAQTAPQRGAAVSRPVAKAVRIETPPTIDGVLEDPAWKHAVGVDRFVQQIPVEGAAATEHTTVYVAYDSETLYLAADVRYSDAGLIRANRVDRDQTENDDTLTFYFDTFVDQQRGYAFSVNAYGVQADSILGGASATGDSTWNALFESAGTLTAGGWTAEVAIPVKSLRYPFRRSGEMHRWGFQVQRTVKSKNETVHWSPVSSDTYGFLAQMGTLEGVSDLSVSRNFELLPTVTAVRAERLRDDNLVADSASEAGVSLKYGIRSNLVFDFTFNPDFSQIESDRPQIEVNQRFPVQYAEQRPFFLEGAEILRVTAVGSLVHTRTIVDPQLGAKLTGKAGRTTFGVLVADDEAPGNVDDPDPRAGRRAYVAMGRAIYDLYPESFVGTLISTREFMGEYSRLTDLDGQFRVGRSHFTAIKGVLSFHRDAAGVERRGHAVDWHIRKEGRHFTYLAYTHFIDPDFRTDTGFIRRVDQRRAVGTATYRWWPESTVINWGPSGQYERNYTYTGQLQDEVASSTLRFEFVNNISASSTFTRAMERYREQRFFKNRISGTATFNTSRRLLLRVDMEHGDEIRFIADPYLGRTTVFTTAAVFRPFSRLQSDIDLRTTNFDAPDGRDDGFDVKIVRAQTSYQFTDRIVLRNILEHNTLDRTYGVNVLVTYRVNSGTAFFMGYDDRQGVVAFDDEQPGSDRYQRTGRAVFMKLQYLIRR